MKKFLFVVGGATLLCIVAYVFWSLASPETKALIIDATKSIVTMVLVAVLSFYGIGLMFRSIFPNKK